MAMRSRLICAGVPSGLTRLLNSVCATVLAAICVTALAATLVTALAAPTGTRRGVTAATGRAGAVGTRAPVTEARTVLRAERADGPRELSAAELAAEVDAEREGAASSVSADAAGMPSAVPTPRKIASAPTRPTNLP
jgi:hypothetical protein